MAGKRSVRRELLRVVLGLVCATAIGLVAYYGLMAVAHQLTTK